MSTAHMVPTSETNILNVAEVQTPSVWGPGTGAETTNCRIHRLATQLSGIKVTFWEQEPLILLGGRTAEACAASALYSLAAALAAAAVGEASE